MSIWEIGIGKWRPVYSLGLFYLRHSPFDLFKEFLRHGVAGHTESPVSFTNCDGITFELDMSSFIERFIYCFHYYEPSDVAVVRSLLRPGDVVMDVGANVGQYALMAAKRVGSSGAIYAFEPSPNILSKLRHNLELNELSNLQIVPCAAGSESGLCDFYPAAGYNQGIGSLVHQGDDDAGTRSTAPIQVEVITLDAFCDSADVDHIDFIKIDAEGYDLEVLKGAVRTLKSNRNIIVMVEMVEKEADANDLCVEIERFMHSLDFQVFCSANRSPFNTHVSGKLVPMNPSLRDGPVNAFFIRDAVAGRAGLL